MSRLAERFGTSLPVIGCIWLPPLPDCRRSPGLPALVEHALAGLEALREGGADGVLIVNANDIPQRVRAQPETISAMNRITRAVIDRKGDLLVGCQILLNDPIASLAVARTSGADFIRCDHFVDPMQREEHGVMMLDPDGLLAYRDEIDAHDILILADIQIRDALMLEERSLRESARQAALHHADGIVVTGEASGLPPDDADLREALAGIGDSGFDVPLLLGGGLDAANAATLLPLCDGAIVGTAVSETDDEWPVVDPDSVRTLMQAVDAIRND